MRGLSCVGVLVIVVLYLSCVEVEGNSPAPAASTDPKTVLVWQVVNPVNNTLPGPRFNPAGATYQNGDKWTIFGGEKHKDTTSGPFIYSDLWDFDFPSNTWISRSYTGQVPPATWRSGLYTIDNRFLLWGGRNSEANRYIDASSISVLPPGTNDDPPQWYQESARFSTNQLSGYTWVAVNAEDEEHGIYTIIYVFGGTDSFEVSGVGVTWKHTLATIQDWTEVLSKEVNDIPARYFHTSIYRPSDHKWYVFGGTQNVWEGVNLHDLWAFDFHEEEWTKLIPLSACVPQPRALHAAALHPEDIGMFVFGGLLNERSSVADLWMWHFYDSRWVQFKTGGWSDPDNRRDGHLMTFWTDAAGNAWLYVFAGDMSNDKKIGFLGDATQFNDLHRIALSTKTIGCTKNSVSSCNFVFTEEECVGMLHKGLSWKVWLIILLVIVGVVALIIGGICYYQKFIAKPKENLSEIYYSDDEGI
eukprot:TRINITY_DN180_c0_g1_i1.p1 TRINITY_DN180_c0_g1~~TRINITY_DN180_c0_g1_i1.p1  ORF type:complete len:488 (-),score=90.09 TRINITY_DN180_c0_g1_i1:147-1562(-)